MLVGRLNGDEFDPFGAHDRTKTASTVGTHVAVRVLNRNVGAAHLHFAGRADGDDADLVTEPLVEGLDHGEIALADNLGLFLDGDAAGIDVQAVPFAVVSRFAFDDQGLDAQFGQHLRRGAAGIRFFDGAGQRAFGTDREAAGVGCLGAGKQARGKNQFVVLAQRMTGGFDFSGDDG